MNKKEEFIKNIKHQLNIQLENDKNNVFNKKRNVLYTKVEKINDYINLLRYLDKNKIMHNCHIDGNIWIWV